MQWSLELVVLPVRDQQRAKDFYVQRAGFTCTADSSPAEGFRVVQVTPPGSACGVALMANPEAAGSVQGLHLVVDDVEQAAHELRQGGVEVSDVFHFDGGGQRPGPDPERRSYNSFCAFEDPDGNGWLVQEVRRTEASTP